MKEAHRPQVPDAAAEPVLGRRAWAGTGRPIRPIRTTTPRTGASRSRSIRPKRRDDEVDGRAWPRASALFALRVPPAPHRALAARCGRGGARSSWSGGSSTRGATPETRLDLAGHAAEPGEVVAQLPQPAERARAAGRASPRRCKRVLIGFGLAVARRRAARHRSPARGAWSKRPARRSRCSAATCRWPR